MLLSLEKDTFNVISFPYIQDIKQIRIGRTKLWNLQNFKKVNNKIKAGLGRVEKSIVVLIHFCAFTSLFRRQFLKQVGATVNKMGNSHILLTKKSLIINHIDY